MKKMESAPKSGTSQQQERQLAVEQAAKHIVEEVAQMLFKVKEGIDARKDNVEETTEDTTMEEFAEASGSQAPPSSPVPKLKVLPQLARKLHEESQAAKRDKTILFDLSKDTDGVSKW